MSRWLSRAVGGLGLSALLSFSCWAAEALAQQSANTDANEPPPAAEPGAEAEPAPKAKPKTMVVYTDVDDDDNDGEPDLSAKQLKPPVAELLDPLAPTLGELTKVEGDAVRLVQNNRPLAKVDGAKRGKIAVQGTTLGRSTLFFSKGELEVNVLELRAYDTRDRRVDLARSHASMSRVLPTQLYPESRSSERLDPDALYWLVIGNPEYLPDRLTLVSRAPEGAELDRLSNVKLSAVNCPGDALPEYQCRRTPTIRAVGDAIDRNHPATSKASLVAEVGGRISVSVDGRQKVSLRVGGPRHSAVGPIRRLRATIRTHIVRASKGGSPPLGSNTAGAKRVVERELHTASGLWGQCGVHFGPQQDQEVEVVDPPPPYLLALGCDEGLPASGGKLTFAVNGQRIEVPTRADETPTEVAYRVIGALQKAGFAGEFSGNARVLRGALRTVDVLVRDRDKALATLAPLAEIPLSTDPSMTACIGTVDLSDGLTHFTDFDAAAGTVEERALIKAFDDGDPTTIEVFVIPHFAQSGRIGESFIYADGASVRNAVIIDRAGIRAAARSHTLAHEIGHILLDMPGHPDDYGVDMPSTLMDADAADATIFGPRRLSVAECERAIRQSGPTAPAPLLHEWPLYGHASLGNDER